MPVCALLRVYYSRGPPRNGSGAPRKRQQPARQQRVGAPPPLALMRTAAAAFCCLPVPSRRNATPSTANAENRCREPVYSPASPKGALCVPNFGSFPTETTTKGLQRRCTPSGRQFATRTWKRVFHMLIVRKDLRRLWGWTGPTICKVLDQIIFFFWYSPFFAYDLFFRLYSSFVSTASLVPSRYRGAQYKSTGQNGASTR